MSLDAWFLSRARVSAKQHGRASLDDKMTFFQQLGSLLASGTPLLRALHVSAEQNQSKTLQAVMEEVAERVASGMPLHTAIEATTDMFPMHWVAMIATGEATGKLDEVLVDLNRQIREAADTRSKFIGSMIYPCVLIFVAVLVVFAMLWFVVPTFGDMFKEMGAELPGITVFVLDISDQVAAYGLYIVAGFCVGGYFFKRWLNTEAGRRRSISVMVAIPVVGDLVIQSSMYRFASNLALLLKSGVPMLETMQTVADVFAAQPPYREAIEYAKNRMAAGRSLADGLEESGLFTSMMVNAVRVGEESAQLGRVMEEIAPYYREKTQAFMSRVTKLAEPAIIMVMGAVISVVMLAIYIPMFEMAGNVK
ncbi:MULTISPECIES: type II secretion system F family protein [Stieleria]|uniref:Type II secretion system protein F n=1 Tax=Stieleria magnilauensis TaxID=2527963 RepID=A0ABX5XNM3_9BACT|nr:type II secretion system F family protein [Stieleria sedimenti]MCS7466102.1 type II secretion system F family protein [Stieleria sedimenti]MDV6031265.1 type II secretion system F family protein [Phycisphaera sp. RhM]QDV83282.1 Type II secretion system protein F [Planctomycetes bacterium TBK1r]